jgi:hypothetical protein
MQAPSRTIFFSYARADSEFALKLAIALRSAGAHLWVDQLDIPAGHLWDRSIEEALRACLSLLVILSPRAVTSNNVLDEVSFALEQNKRIVPVLYQVCEIPFRLGRVQYVDFTVDYDTGFKNLLQALDDQLSQTITLETQRSLDETVGDTIQHQRKVNQILNDSSLSVEEKVWSMLIAITKKMNKDIERQMAYLGSISQDPDLREAETLKLWRMMDKRKQVDDMVLNRFKRPLP